jgi:hypothetical protein
VNVRLDIFLTLMSVGPSGENFVFLHAVTDTTIIKNMRSFFITLKN